MPNNPFRNGMQSLSIRLLLLLSFVLLFYFLFAVFQNGNIYRQTLGKITHTYENVDGAYDIRTSNHPYTSISKENTVNWDAEYYNYLKDHHPGPEDTYLGIRSFGFFPMYAWIWKVSGLSSMWVGILNFFMFGIALLIFAFLFIETGEMKVSLKHSLFFLALAIPSIATYLIPYSEATFTLMFAIAVLGLWKKNYPVFFIGMLAFSMSRASIVIVIAALLVTDLYFLLIHRKFALFLKDFFLKIIPVALGMITVFFIHYYYSGNFLKYYEVQSSLWENNLMLPAKIEDWSHEGFSMNTAAIFLVFLPALMILLRKLWLEIIKRKDTITGTVFGGEKEVIKAYLWTLCLVFFAGFSFYILLFRGGSVHCLHRFIITAPFFFIFLFMLPEKLVGVKKSHRIIISIAFPLAGLIFLLKTPVEPAISFMDWGYMVFVLAFLFLLWMEKLGVLLRYLLLAGIIGLNMIWLTYLYNNYICCSWIWA